MKSIGKEIVNEIIINKSRFISVLCNINNKDEVNSKILEYKNKYKDATHYCYAYIIDGYCKCCDDGEPSGTAGMPILNVLQNNDLTNVLCLVIRYFGGVKLGAGGLVRAYSRSVSEILKVADINDLVDGYYIEIEFDYDSVKTIDYLLKDVFIDKKFEENIIYSFKISKDFYLEIEDVLLNKTNILKKESILITV